MVAATSVLVTAAPAAAVPVPAACTSAGLTVTALHGPNFYVDTSSSPVLRGAYAGYRVTDTTGNPRTDLWVELGDPARPNASDRDKAANRRVEVYVG